MIISIFFLIVILCWVAYHLGKIQARIEDKDDFDATND